MSLLLDDGDVRLYHGDALTVLRELPAESVHMCVTSPPFFGLRDYQTGRWEGGNPDCDHKASTGEPRKFTNGRGEGSDDEYAGSNLRAWTTRDGTTYGQTCGKCGATRVDQQIGLEETPEQWVDSLVAVFREVRRVLRDDGTLWLEVGDSYNSRLDGSRGNWDSSQTGKTTSKRNTPDATNSWRGTWPGAKPKDLIGAPWMLAFALRADGWYLRSDIVWARPNPMPESVTDRPTKSHSYVFLLSKQPRYFFDQEAVREPHTGPMTERRLRVGVERQGPKMDARDGNRTEEAWRANGLNPAGRNVRSVWNIPTQPYPEAHFATFPEELARRCILAGTSERGCCPECGAPWVREVRSQSLERHELPKNDPRYRPARYEGKYDELHGGNNAMRYHESETLSWNPSCWCRKKGKTGIATPDPTPCVVLDPFVGSGTVPFVARKHGRHSIGIDLSGSYLELAARRLQQLSLFA